MSSQKTTDDTDFPAFGMPGDAPSGGGKFVANPLLKQGIINTAEIEISPYASAYHAAAVKSGNKNLLAIANKIILGAALTVDDYEKAARAGLPI
jgi:hypothetical protein